MADFQGNFYDSVIPPTVFFFSIVRAAKVLKNLSVLPFSTLLTMALFLCGERLVRSDHTTWSCLYLWSRVSLGCHDERFLKNLDYETPFS